jgi:hypothetical protein
MHYKNGREAKAGDVVLNLSTGNTGILHTVNAGSESCNGRIARVTSNDDYVTIGECLHLDDIRAALVPPPAIATP